VLACGSLSSIRECASRLSARGRIRRIYDHERTLSTRLLRTYSSTRRLRFFSSESTSCRSLLDCSSSSADLDDGTSAAVADGSTGLPNYFSSSARSYELPRGASKWIRPESELARRSTSADRNSIAAAVFESLPSLLGASTVSHR